MKIEVGRNCNVIENLGIFLLIWMTGIVIVTPTLFLIGISISSVNLIIPLIVGTLFLMKDDKCTIYEKIVVFCVGILIVTLLVISCGAVYDQTWDGCAYHKTAVGLLKNGWNPLYDTAFEINENAKILPYADFNPMKYAEAYPKAAWYIGAVFYYITGNIETSKVYTLVFALITCFVTFSFFQKKGYSIVKSIILSTLLGFNPMVLDQMQSFYVDGLTGCILIMIMTESLLIIDESLDCEKGRHFFVLALLIIMGCNLKFSTFGFTALTCIVTFLFIAYKNIHDLKKILNILIYYALTAGISIVFIGSAPYVTNFLRYKDIFYGYTALMDPNSLERDFGVVGLGKAGRAIASLFGKMSHGEYHSLGELLKVPFTYSKSELDFYSFVDLRVSGSGILFSGIFVICLCVIMFAFLKKKLNSDQDKLMLLYLALILIELLSFEGTYQIRYVSHIYIIVAYALTILWRDKNRKCFIKRCSLFVSIILIMSMFANDLPWIKLFHDRIDRGIQYKTELQEMARIYNEQPLTVAFWSYAFTGLHFDLYDQGIENFKFVDMSELDNVPYTSIYGYWIMYY